MYQNANMGVFAEPVTYAKIANHQSVLHGNLYIKTIRCSYLFGDKYKFNANVRYKDHKNTKIHHLVHTITIRMLHLTFKFCNNQKVCSNVEHSFMH